MTTEVPTEMTAIEIIDPGGPEALKPGIRAVPTPGDGEVLVKVVAAGVNFPDVMQRRGNYPPPPGASDIPGLEIAGVVVAIGDGVMEIQLGNHVCALVSGGGYAEYCAAPAAQCLPVPDNFEMVRAAAIPETFFTVWTNLIDRGELRSGQWVLIHGGSGGIGTAAIQIAHALGARVLATARTAEKCAVCEKLGAARAINYAEEDFVEIAKVMTGGSGVELIIDKVGGDYGVRKLQALAPGGRLVQVAVQGGASPEIPLFLIMQKHLTLTGSTLRPRSVAEKGAIAAALKERIWPGLDAGELGPLVHATFPLSEAAKAHEMMESSSHIGKIVLTVQNGG
ncbi:MAG: NAD(P)H-quinone oxidoreductase [Pseudomonadota bacterium]|nr:NAD(P)H-quinone oxidoreductase [Pseudomonadota bacterium]